MDAASVLSLPHEHYLALLAAYDAEMGAATGLERARKLQEFRKAYPSVVIVQLSDAEVRVGFALSSSGFRGGAPSFVVNTKTLHVERGPSMR